MGPIGAFPDNTMHQFPPQMKMLHISALWVSGGHTGETWSSCGASAVRLQFRQTCVSHRPRPHATISLTIYCLLHCFPIPQGYTKMHS